MNHIVIFSHGFGVYADDRGLFPDIIKYLDSNVEPIMFDYNQREADNTLIASTLEAQTEKLRKVYRATRAKHPNATIDLICHSQGCVIAALAQLEGVRKTIFLAPADDKFGQNIDEKIQDVTERKMRPGTKVFEDGTISYPRRDGSTTIIPKEYWESRRDVMPVHLYESLATRTELIIVQATNDEVIGLTDFSELSNNVRIIQMKTGHDFEGEDREKVAHSIANELGVNHE